MQRVAKTLPETIRVPLWWYIIQNLNEWFHSIVSKAIPVLEEPRALRSSFFLTSIADQPISKELKSI